MTATSKVSWKFPRQKLALSKIEAFFVGLLALFILLFSYFQLDGQVLWAILLALVFIIFYVLVAYITKSVRQNEEQYHFTKTHLEHTSKTKNRASKLKVPLKHIVKHKLDRFFLGGYLVTKQGKKHLLYFNTRQELERFGKFISKYTKPNA